jgi:hypothetical protein
MFVLLEVAVEFSATSLHRRAGPFAILLRIPFMGRHSLDLSVPLSKASIWVIETMVQFCTSIKNRV